MKLFYKGEIMGTLSSFCPSCKDRIETPKKWGYTTLALEINGETTNMTLWRPQMLQLIGDLNDENFNDLTPTKLEDIIVTAMDSVNSIRVQHITMKRKRTD